MDGKKKTPVAFDSARGFRKGPRRGHHRAETPAEAAGFSLIGRPMTTTTAHARNGKSRLGRQQIGEWQSVETEVPGFNEEVLEAANATSRQTDGVPDLVTLVDDG